VPTPRKKKLKRPSRSNAVRDNDDASALGFLAELGLPDPKRGLSGWRARLGRKNRFVGLLKRFGAGRACPLSWGWAAEEFQPEFGQELKSVSKAARDADAKTLEKWGEALFQSGPTEADALSATIREVLLAEVIPVILASESCANGLGLLERLCRRIEQNRQVTFLDPRLELLAKIELPLTSAFQLAELTALRQIAAESTGFWEASLNRWVRESGGLTDGWWPWHRALFAAWVRSLRLIESLGLEAPADESRGRLAKLFRQVARGACSNAQALLVAGDLSCGYRRLTRLAEQVLQEESGLKGAPRKQRATARGLCDEDSRLTLLRTRWGRRGTKFGLRHDESAGEVHLWRDRSILWGNCTPAVRVGTESIHVQGQWRVSCFHADREVQAVDLEMQIAPGVCLQRTVVLGLDDEFLLWADAVLLAEPQAIAYELTLPLAQGISAISETETTECYLRGEEGAVALVMPLSAPEWTAARSPARLEASPAGLTMRHAVDGRVLFAPLFVGCRPIHALRARTWRRLTVACHRAAVPADQAMGFRIRVGDQQWLLFRSFGQKEPYSVLSMQLLCEFYLGRIERNQTITDLLRIEHV
jgi:hypothetical protein